MKLIMLFIGSSCSLIFKQTVEKIYILPLKEKTLKPLSRTNIRKRVPLAPTVSDISERPNPIKQWN